MKLWIFLSSLSLLLSVSVKAESLMAERFEYELPILDQVSGDGEPHFTKCKVKSFMYEGDKLYYQTYLTGPTTGPKNFSEIASANTRRGVLTPNSFSYSDIVPEYVRGEGVVQVKYETTYVLDAQTQRVLSVELRATKSSGQLKHRFVCGDLNS